MLRSEDFSLENIQKTIKKLNNIHGGTQRYNIYAKASVLSLLHDKLDKDVYTLIPNEAAGDMVYIVPTADAMEWLPGYALVPQNMLAKKEYGSWKIL